MIALFGYLQVKNALSLVSRFIPFMAWGLCSVAKPRSHGEARELKDSSQQQFVKEPFVLSGILFLLLGV